MPPNDIQEPKFVHQDELRRIGPVLQKPAQGRLLWEWLSEKHPFYSADQWRVEIETGHITVNQQVTCDPFQSLHQGDRLARIHPLEEEPEVDTEMSVVWRDEDIAVVVKPAGLPMHEAAYFRRKTVHWILPRLLKGDWHATHRLDRETSGLLVCARGSHVRKQLAEAFEHGLVEKTYLALCYGVCSQRHWVCRKPIIPAISPKDKAHCTDSVPNAGLRAETHFKLLKNSCDQNLSLIEAQPKTGRTHQNRVHLASEGFPIVGDKVYARNSELFRLYLRDGNTPEVRALAGADNHRLHAWKVSFQHPISGRDVFIEAPIPDSFTL